MSNGTGRLAAARLRGQPVRTRALLAGILALALVLLSQLAIADARAMADPNQVTGLTVTQGEGFATLAWTPVAGATDYQIERTPVDDANVPTGASVIVGVWQPIRTVTPGSPRFAEAGFALGGRYQWRVRARFGTTAQPYSEPVFGTTRPQWGTGPGAGLRTGWETSGNATYTTYAQEIAYTEALDAASDRFRFVELGRTDPDTGDGAPGNYAINMFIIGYPSPPATAAAISNRPTILYNCNVHGNEPQGRESCLIFARMLSFTEDPHLLEILSNVTVLIVPTMNGNGRAGNDRGDETDADLNRDHALLRQAEPLALAKGFRDYTPDMALDLHEGDSEDLPILTSRHLNVYEPLAREGKEGLVESWMYDKAAETGWWHGPYHTGGDSNEGILRNTLGLKNILGMLGENRASGGNTRPAEGTQLANRNRKSYGSLWEEFNALEYFWANMAKVRGIVADAMAYQSSNLGRIVLRGSYPWGLHPRFPVHDLPDFDDDPADNPDPTLPNQSTSGNLRGTDYVNPARIIEQAPCGYFVTETQFSGPAPGIGPPLNVRLDAHGVKQETRPSGHVVRLAQPLRGLIPMLLDSATLPPIEPSAPVGGIVHGLRLSDCPYLTAAPRTFSATLFDGQSETSTLTIGNIAPDANEPLNWTITEAVSDCASPSDLPWVSASLGSGSTPSQGGSTNVQITLSTAGLTSPASPTGVLCLASNDAGEALVTIPVGVTLRSLRAELQAIAASLSARLPLANARDDKALRKAIDALAYATAEAVWDDGARVDGSAAFDGAQQAVIQLQSISGSPAWATEAAKAIASIAGEISQLAIDEADAGPARELAGREQARGDARFAAGDYDAAVGQYRKAWNYARRA
jgi:hypothetical protein